MNHNNIAVHILFCIRHIETYGWKDILSKIDFYADKKSCDLMIKLFDKHAITDREIKLLSFCILSGFNEKDSELKSLFTACCLFDLFENGGKFTFTDNGVGFVKESALLIYKELDKSDIERINRELNNKNDDDFKTLKKRMKKNILFKYFCL